MLDDTTCSHDLVFPVKNWVKPDLDLSFYPDKFPDTEDGLKRTWALQYPSSDKILSTEAIQFLKSIDVQPSVAGHDTVNLFRGDPNAVMHIHQDPGPRFSLNYVWGSADSDMIWYKEGEKVERKWWTSVTGRRAMSFSSEGMVEIHRTKMTGLKLVRIDVPHNVENRDTNTRWAVCVKDTGKNWSWEQATEFFKPWIKK
jgi:hypothetical protein